MVRQSGLMKYLYKRYIENFTDTTVTTECFHFEKVKELFGAGPVMNIGKKQFRTVSQDTKDYIHKYFFQTKTGNYYFWDAQTQEYIVYEK